jgi:hypothetical protein
MTKKAEAISQIFTFLIVILLIGILALFGYNAFMKIKEKQCQSELLSFKEDLKTSIEEIARREGASIEKSYLLGCGVKKIYFIDRQQTIEKQTLNENAEINDSIHSPVRDNMFILKGNKVIDQMEIGPIALVPPYFACVNPSGGLITITLEGKDGKVLVQPQGPRFSCGPTLVKPIVNDTEVGNVIGIIDESEADIGTPLPPDAFDKYTRTRDYVDITRELIKKEDTIIVNIKINPKPGITLTDFTYYEQISKECILKITTPPRNILFNTQDIVGSYDGIDMDPLIMWHLTGDINTPQQIYYVIKDNNISGFLLDSTKFEEFCRELLSGFGFSDSVTTT